MRVAVVLSFLSFLSCGDVPPPTEEEWAAWNACDEIVGNGRCPSLADGVAKHVVCLDALEDRWAASHDKMDWLKEHGCECFPDKPLMPYCQAAR